MEVLPGFILAALALCGSPGPATVSLAATGAAFGGRRGFLYMSGIDAGMLVVMSVTAGGVTGLVLAIPGAKPVVGILASLYFVHLAWRIAMAPPLSASSPEHREPSFLAGVALSLINPKGYAAMAALFSGFVLVQGRADLDVVLKLTVLIVIVVSVNAAWLLSGTVLTGYFRKPRTSRVINVTFAVLLIASVGAAFLV
jgi:threonine/homoserine/homoserine lactone efflux protein